MIQDALSKDDWELAERRRWHLQFYHELHVDPVIADLLDVAGVDPHDVASLLLHGCPESLLVQILT